MARTHSVYGLVTEQRNCRELCSIDHNHCAYMMLIVHIQSYVQHVLYICDTVFIPTYTYCRYQYGTSRITVRNSSWLWRHTETTKACGIRASNSNDADQQAYQRQTGSQARLDRWHLPTFRHSWRRQEIGSGNCWSEEAKNLQSHKVSRYAPQMIRCFCSSEGLQIVFPSSLAFWCQALRTSGRETSNSTVCLGDEKC